MLAEPQTQLGLSDFQERVLAVPEEYEVFLGGGRGGGKSFTLALLAMRHAEQYREKARILFVRQSLPGAQDFIALTRDLFGKVYGTGASYNASSHVWTLPNDSYFEIGMLGDWGDVDRYQGRSFSLILIDEAGQWPDPALLDLLRSNLRGPTGVPVRVALAANPGGVGHLWLAQRYVFRAPAWSPFVEGKSGRTFVHCPSTYRDNDFIDQNEYGSQIKASTATDPELGKAWLAGDWAVARGAFFGGVLEESRSCIEPWPTPEEHPRWYWEAKGCGWKFELAHDYGVTAPSVTYVVARSGGSDGPDGKNYPRGSIVLLDELATNEPGSLSKGMGYTIPHLAEQITGLSEYWGLERAEGVADDAIFNQTGSQIGSISDEFRRYGVYFRRAGKGSRVAGWERLRRLMADAGKPDVPGLYVSRVCEYFWSTVPYLGRDPRRVDDVDTRSVDHAADAARYAVLAESHIATIEPIWL